MQVLLTAVQAKQHSPEQQARQSGHLDCDRLPIIHAPEDAAHLGLHDELPQLNALQHPGHLQSTHCSGQNTASLLLTPPLHNGVDSR